MLLRESEFRESELRSGGGVVIGDGSPSDAIKTGEHEEGVLFVRAPLWHPFVFANSRQRGQFGKLPVHAHAHAHDMCMYSWTRHMPDMSGQQTHMPP